jgi:type III pantothenate kinase
MVSIKGARNVALITGEEKIVPPDARWFSCTVEAMPLDRPVEFIAVDEIQLCADADRGHVFTDRLLNALAAHQTYGGPLIVVDFGTATTFDVVDQSGAYIGGAIAPGINLSVEALHQAAARLPRIGIGRPQRVIGTSTIPAMRSGIYWGYVGLVEGLITRIEAEYGRPMKTIATGGLAPLIAEGSPRIERTDPDLTLEGLRLLSLRNPAPPLRNREPDND